MNALEVLHEILKEKRLKGIEDFIDIRFSRDQAEELYGMIHRIITYDKNMKKDKENV